MFGIDARAARATWTVLLIALLCLVIYTIRGTLFIFFVALLFAYLLLPIVDFIDRVVPAKRSRVIALAIVYLVLVAGLVITGIEIGSTVAQQANTLSQRLSDLLKPEQAQPSALPQPVRPIAERIFSAAWTAVQDHYQEILQTLPQAVMKALGAAASLVFLVIVPILSFFFLKDGRMLQRYVVAQVSDSVNRDVLRGIANDLNVLLAQYMRALVILGLAASITYGIVFTILGVPYAVLLSAMAFPLEFIPMLGPITSAIMILAVAGFSGYQHLLVLAIFLAVYRIFQDYVLSPHLLSAGMELHPLLVVFGVFAGEQIAGIAGAFLSVPVMAVLRMVYQRLERARLRREGVSEDLIETAK